MGNMVKIQKLCIQMIQNNLVHFIASDAHHNSNRPFILKSLFKNKKLSKYHEEMKQLIENAQFIIDNEDFKNKPLKLTNIRNCLNFLNISDKLGGKIWIN